jgi:hypothetical protein
LAHTVFVDDATGKLEVVGSQQLRTDGSYDIKLDDNMLASFAGILIDLPGHGFTFLDRETCKKPDVDIQLAFADIPDFNPKEGSLALLVDGLFPLDLTPLIAKWTPVLQQRLGAIPGATLLATTADKKGCYYQTGLTSGKLRKISGRVTDGKGKPIAANVSIKYLGELDALSHRWVAAVRFQPSCIGMVLGSRLYVGVLLGEPKWNLFQFDDSVCGNDASDLLQL